MTQRKPPGVRFETWVDKLIREATERGEFEGLPGTGRPIADLGEADDEDWWIRQKLRRENVTFLPPSLLLRKEAEDALAAARRAPSEAEARRIVDEVNQKIREGIRKPMEGPPLNLMPFDVDEVVGRWRSDHPPTEPSAPPAGDAGDGGEAAAVTRRRSLVLNLRPRRFRRR